MWATKIPEKKKTSTIKKIAIVGSITISSFAFAGCASFNSTNSLNNALQSTTNTIWNMNNLLNSFDNFRFTLKNQSYETYQKRPSTYELINAIDKGQSIRFYKKAPSLLEAMNLHTSNKIKLDFVQGNAG